eukprot:5552011-Pleurochrysis_carterae.AAC.2
MLYDFGDGTLDVVVQHAQSLLEYQMAYGTARCECLVHFIEHREAPLYALVSSVLVTLSHRRESTPVQRAEVTLRVQLAPYGTARRACKVCHNLVSSRLRALESPHRLLQRLVSPRARVGRVESSGALLVSHVPHARVWRGRAERANTRVLDGVARGAGRGAAAKAARLHRHVGHARSGGAEAGGCHDGTRRRTCRRRAVVCRAACGGVGRGARRRLHGRHGEPGLAEARRAAAEAARRRVRVGGLRRSVAVRVLAYTACAHTEGSASAAVKADALDSSGWWVGLR